jgi:hypothetical protein
MIVAVDKPGHNGFAAEIDDLRFVTNPFLRAGIGADKNKAIAGNSKRLRRGILFIDGMNDAVGEYEIGRSALALATGPAHNEYHEDEQSHGGLLLLKRLLVKNRCILMQVKIIKFVADVHKIL